jgi:hypothetical protein
MDRASAPAAGKLPEQAAAVNAVYSASDRTDSAGNSVANSPADPPRHFRHLASARGLARDLR